MKIKSNIEGLVDLFLTMYFLLGVRITDFLTFYFIPTDYSKDGDRRQGFIEYFLDDFKFKRKSEILTKIFETKFPQFKKIILDDNFKKIVTIRNKIAHSIVDFDIDTSDYTKSKLHLKNFKKGELKSIYFNYKDVDEAIACCENIYKILDVEVKKMREFSISLEGACLAHAENQKKLEDKDHRP